EGDNTYTDATDKVVSILKFCKEPKYRKEIYDLIGVTYQQWNFKAFIEPLLKHDYLELTVPDKPTSPKQQYRTTKKGLLFLETI
ncbi:Fic family protein, partial [Segatella copri]